MSSDAPSEPRDLDLGTCDPTERHVGVRLIGRAADLELDDVEIEEAVVETVDLEGGRVTRLALVGVEVRRVSAVTVELSDGRLARVSVTASRLAGCAVDGSVWEDVEVADVRASRLSARQVTWRRVTFTDCDLTGLDLTSARLDRVRFERCAITDAELSGLQLTAASFVDCDLAGARGVSSLRGATVDTATLTSLTGPMAAELGLRVQLG